MTDPGLSRRFDSAQAALAALDNPPPRPDAIAKPEHSQVRLTFYTVIAGIRWRRRHAPRAAIDRIVLQQAKRLSSQDQVIRTLAKLTIWAGRDAFVLAEGLLSEADVYWLADQLSCWLDLPLTTDES